MGKLVLRQTGSTIGTNPSVKKILRALGLGKIGETRVHKDNNCIRGMVNKVRHLLDVELLVE